MLAQRLRGLLILHTSVSTACAALFFEVYASVYSFVPRVQRLSSDVPKLGFLLCIVLGTIAGSRHLILLSTRFHRVTWVDAANLATRQVLFSALVVFAFIFAFKEIGLSRLFLGSYFCFCWIILVLMDKGLPRLLSRFLFERSRRLPTLFVGPSRNLSKLQGWLASKEVLGLQPVGFLTTESNPDKGSTAPFLGGLEQLQQVIEDRHVAQVVLLEIPHTRDEGDKLIETCQQLGCRLLIYSDTANFFRHPLVTVNEEGYQFYSLSAEPLEDPLNRIVKRLFDIAISLPVVMFVLPPLSVWVWLMQRWEAPGPLLFIQKRAGHGKQTFEMLKFRSMFYRNRDEGAESEQAKLGDPRIFAFGGFLRRTSLDEFPQFLNVLLGSMSIVGPRPHMVIHDQKFERMMLGYRTRFFAKPGITGLAQSNGFRGEISDADLLRRRVECDITYITQWSIWLDLKITIKTAIQVMFPPRSAY